MECNVCKKGEETGEFVFQGQDKIIENVSVDVKTNTPKIEEIASNINNFGYQDIQDDDLYSEAKVKLLVSKHNLDIDKEAIEAKNSVEEHLKKFGAEISDADSSEIDQILDKVNPLAKEVNLPKEMINGRLTDKAKDIFYIPLVKLPNGEMYEGFWNRDGKKHGYGIKVNDDGTVYKGFWNNDVEEDFGVFVGKNNDYYIGELINGKQEGKGKLVEKGKFEYEGQFKDGKQNGNGTLKNLVENYIYVGDMVDLKKEGKGNLRMNDGTSYSGEFENDLFSGNGKLIFPNGNSYEGTFKNGKMDGSGTFKWADGRVYEGEYKDGLRSGKGKMNWNENQYYEGEWLNDQQHGEGRYFIDGKETSGKFRFGKIINAAK